MHDSMDGGGSPRLDQAIEGNAGTIAEGRVRGEMSRRCFAINLSPALSLKEEGVHAMNF